MRALLVLLTACSSSTTTIVVVADGGQDAATPPVVIDAAPDVVIDAGQDAGPVLGSPCDNPGYPCGNSTLTCYQTHSVSGVDMYGRCTFSCCFSDCASGKIDTESQIACRARGGECAYPNLGGPGPASPICMPN